MSERYEEVRALVIESGKASASYVQRKLYMGWNEARENLDRLEAEGFVSAMDNVGRRDVLRFNLAPANPSTDTALTENRKGAE